MAIPRDDFTPHGLLWTLGHHARGWHEPVGGVGATDPLRIGAGFRLLAPRRMATLAVSVRLHDGTLLEMREQFLAHGELSCGVHTARRMVLTWHGAGASLELLVFSAGPQALGFQLLVAGGTAIWQLHGAVPAHAVAVVDDRRLMLGRVSEVLGSESAAWFALDGARPVWEAGEAWQADERFWANAPQLSGDWPVTWRRGWVYDLETTRLLVQPPGGINSGPWPSWMAEWPRTVAAEGSLDMARLAMADTPTALAALETLWTQAPAPNLPCIFRDGQPNMVAADGRVCGTSPAWCLPLQQVEQAFLWSGDTAWLARILPALEAFLAWWERERVVDGYPSYACTWESGEDDNPRLDPEGSGGGAILGKNRPPELPATFAAGADVLARLARALGDEPRRRHWQQFGARYRDLLEKRYWDPVEGRYRDLDSETGGFLEPRRAAYWQTDSVRQSPLGLLGALVTSAPERRAALARALPALDAPPWRWWPSWSGAILAAADALGAHRFAARFAANLVARVWADSDAREASDEVTGRPLPGVAREYWPEPLADYRVHDGYGRGAETATFFLRHVVGLQPRRDGFGLRPLLPQEMLVPDGSYTLGPVVLQGRRFALTLDRLSRVTLHADEPARYEVHFGGQRKVLESSPAGDVSWHMARGFQARVRVLT